MREHAGPAPRHQQRRDRRDDRAASAADGVGDRRLDRTETLEVEYPAMRSLYSCSAPSDQRHAVRVHAPSTTTTRTAARRSCLDGALAASSAPDDVKKPRAIVHRRQDHGPARVLRADRAAGRRGDRRAADRSVDRGRAPPQLKESDQKTLQSAFLRARARAPAASHRNPSRRSSARAAIRTWTSRSHAPAIRSGTFTRLRSTRPRRRRSTTSTPSNRTAASQRVADLVQALDESPGAHARRRRRLEPAGLCSPRQSRRCHVIVDVDRFDTWQRSGVRRAALACPACAAPAIPRPRWR